MQAFETLTSRGQLRRLHTLATQTLAAYDLVDPVLTFINHGENTTYRVDERGRSMSRVAETYQPHRFLLRVHSPTYNTPTEIESEMEWLAALRRDTRLAVPEPVLTRAATLTTHIAVAGVPQPRTCTLMRWMNGSLQWKHMQLQHMQQAGTLMANLHQHARTWQRPASFTRRRWDWDGMFGDNAHLDCSIDVALARIPNEHRSAIEQVIARFQTVLNDLGESPATFGLIHGDLHFWNMLFTSGEARAIDFDDCGFGYWITDIAITLGRWRRQATWNEIVQAFITGYESVLAFPHDQRHLIDECIVAREVAVLLWVASKAIHDPFFRDYEPQRLNQVLDWIDAYKRGFEPQ